MLSTRRYRSDVLAPPPRCDEGCLGWGSVKHGQRPEVHGLRLLGVLVALGLLVWTFADLDFARVSEVLSRVGAPRLAWVLAPMGVALALESLGWAWSFWRAGYNVPYRGIWRARVTSEALALTLPAG